MFKQSFIGRSVFWLVMAVFLTLVFGQSSKDYGYTFFFVATLLPVAVATSYFFNQYLVPNYLQKGKHLKFGLYLFYTLIISLWLEMVIMVVAFIFLANYNYENMSPETTNLVYLGLSLYFIVFVDGFRLTFLKLQAQQKKLEQISKAERDPFITVKADRKQQQVDLNKLLYVESLGDYVKLHSEDGVLITRERISKMTDKLPVYFLRIHRSFLVNTKKIDSFSREFVLIDGNEIPISRTYKSKAIQYLEKS